MTRHQAFTIIIRALNEKLARTKHKPTRRRLNAAKDFYINDPAWALDNRPQSLPMHRKWPERDDA